MRWVVDQSMIELNGITYYELKEKYDNFREVRTMHKSGYAITCSVTDNIRIESKKRYYKKRGPSHTTEVRWKIIGHPASKKMDQEIKELRDSFFKNKTPAELAVVANLLKEE